MPFSFSSVHRDQPYLVFCSFLLCFRCFGRVFIWTCSVWSCGLWCLRLHRENQHFGFVFNASKLRCSNYRYFLRHSHSLLAAHCFDRVERTMPLIAYWDVWISCEPMPVVCVCAVHVSESIENSIQNLRMKTRRYLPWKPKRHTIY